MEKGKLQSIIERKKEIAEAIVTLDKIYRHTTSIGVVVNEGAYAKALRVAIRELKSMDKENTVGHGYYVLAKEIHDRVQLDLKKDEIYLKHCQISMALSVGAFVFACTLMIILKTGWL